MRNTTLTILLLITTIGLVNCGKDEDEKPPDTPSVINITTPTAGTIVLNGTGLQITGDVADDNALETVRAEVRNSTTNTVMYQQNNTTGNVLFYNYQFNWTVAGVSTTTNAVVKITATDRYGYQVSKEVAIVLID